MPGRPADAAAGDATHRDETCGGAQRSDHGSFKIQFQNLAWADSCEGTNHHRLQWKAAIIQVVKRVDSFWTWWWTWPMEVGTSCGNQQRNHTLQWEKHDESLAPKRQRGRPATPLLAKSRDHPNTQLVCPGLRRTQLQ